MAADEADGATGLFGSDVMAEAIQACAFPYLSINPGASFRGLHDSIVNHTQQGDALIQCPHEKIAVGLAHGYAKATGQPMGVLVHDTVGLLHATMGIYCAYMDRVPLVVFGGTGPMALEARRPHIDWIHTANLQGNVVRDYTKWDDQPATVASVPPTVARAYRVAMSQPQGPVYVALDAGLQEEALPQRPRSPVFDPRSLSTPYGADERALQTLAEALLDARRPVLIAGYAGRDPSAFDQLVELAELVGMGVVDTNIRLNFPSRHPLNVTGTDAIEEADLVFFVDAKDMEKPITRVDPATRQMKSRLRPDARVIALGFNEIGISAWSHDFGALVDTDLSVTGDSAVALPRLLQLCRSMADQEASPRASWVDRLHAKHREVRAAWDDLARERFDDRPVSTARLASEVWEAIRSHDWVLTAGTASDWALRLWDFDRHYRHPGASLGTGTQIGISLGVALAHRKAGRLVVDLQPDGDLLYDASALWTAAYHEIPLLVVMFNNRAYYNDWAHQEDMARQRGRPVENAYLGMDFSDPAPDFAGMARSFGWHGEGPIEDPADLGAALARAVHVVTSERRPALVDVVCQPK